ncbi:MAG: TolC family protein [Verrucomicrobiota bacterium]
MFIFFLYSHSGTEASITWRQAVDLGLRHNAQILQAQKTLEEVSGSKLIAESQLYPQLQTSFFPLPPILLLNFQQSIFTPGVFPAIDKAAEAQEAATANVQLEILEFVFNSKIAFLRILLLEKEIVLQNEFAAKLKAQLDLLPGLFEAGKVDRGDIQTMEVRLELTRSNIEDLKYEKEKAVLEFADLLGTSKALIVLQRGVIGFLQDRDLQLPSIDELVTIALQNRQDLKLLQQLVDVDRKDVRMEAASYYPRMVSFLNGDFRTETPDALAEFDTRRDEDDDEVEQSNMQLGVRINWRLFDGFRTKGDKQAANAVLAQRSVLLDAVRRNIPGEVSGVVRQYKDARRIYRMFQDSDLSKQNSEQVKLAFIQNKITQVEVFKAEEESFLWERNKLLALYNMELACVNLYAATGQLVKLIEN